MVYSMFNSIKLCDTLNYADSLIIITLIYLVYHYYLLKRHMWKWYDNLVNISI